MPTTTKLKASAAKKLPRAKWTKPLAAFLGWRPQKLWNFFHARGYPRPWNDEERGLKLLENAGHDLTAYRAKKKNGNGALHRIPGTSVVVAPHPQATVLPTTAITHGVVHDRLLHRLARLLPERDSPKGLAKARHILTRYGMAGRWTSNADEAECVEVFKREGMPVEKFEWSDESKRPITIPQLTEQQIEYVIREYLKRDPDYWLLERAKEARKALEQFVTAFGKEMRARRLNEPPHPMEYAFTALHWLRTPPD